MSSKEGPDGNTLHSSSSLRGKKLGGGGFCGATDPNTDLALLEGRRLRICRFVSLGGVRKTCAVGDWGDGHHGANPLGQEFSGLLRRHVSAPRYVALSWTYDGTHPNRPQRSEPGQLGAAGSSFFNKHWDGEVYPREYRILSPTGGFNRHRASRCPSPGGPPCHTTQLQSLFRRDPPAAWLGVRIQDVNRRTFAEGLRTHRKTAAALVTDVPDGPSKDARHRRRAT